MAAKWKPNLRTWNELVYKGLLHDYLVLISAKVPNSAFPHRRWIRTRVGNPAQISAKYNRPCAFCVSEKANFCGKRLPLKVNSSALFIVIIIIIIISPETVSPLFHPSPPPSSWHPPVYLGVGLYCYSTNSNRGTPWVRREDVRRKISLLIIVSVHWKVEKCGAIVKRFWFSEDKMQYITFKIKIHYYIMMFKWTDRNIGSGSNEMTRRILKWLPW